MTKQVPVYFGANIDGLLAGISGATEAIEGFAAQVEGLTSVFTGFGEAVMAAFAVEQIASFAEKIIELGVDTERMRQQLGGSALDVQALQLAAEKSDVNISLLTRSMSQFSIKAEDARKGTSNAAMAFQALGINAKEYLASGHTLEQLFELTTERLSGMNDSLEKGAIVSALFSARSSQLVSLLNDLGSGTKKFDEEVERVGGAIMFTFIPAAKESSEKLAVMKIASEDAKAALFMSLKPAIDSVITSMTEMSSAFTHSVMADGTVQRVIDGIVGTFLLLKSALMDVAMGFKDIMIAANTAGEVLALRAHQAVLAWQAIRHPITTGWTGIKDEMKTTDDEVAASWARAAKDMEKNTDDTINKQGKMWHEYFDDIKQRAKDSSVYGPPVPKAKEGGGGKTDAPLLADPGQVQTQLQIWEAALTKMLLDQQLFGEQATQFELKYWQDKLKIQGQGAAQYADIQKKVYELEKQNRSEDLADHKASMQEQLSEVGNDYAARRIIIQQYYDWLKAHYADDTNALKEAQKLQNKNTQDALKHDEQQYQQFFQKFNSSIDGMLTKTMTWQQFMQKAAMNVFNTLLVGIEKVLARWLAKETAQTAATMAGDGARVSADAAAAKASSTAFGEAGKATIMGDAAKAYSGVYGFLAPEIGPFAAIPAGLAFAAVMGMEALIPSFEVGSWKTSAGLAMLHDDEMIIPKGPADSIRSGGGGGGDSMHVTIQCVDQRGIKDLIMQNAPTVAAAVRKQSGKFDGNLTPGWRK